MIKFYTDSVLVGYIKELLTSFNLPTAKIYKNDITPLENQLYIKDNYICQYHDSKYNKIVPYKFGLKYNNYTKNLKLATNSYDSHTHEYLGEYLRFLRDYKDLNLMSLYNCFSDRMPSNLDLEFNGVIFDTENVNYKIYILPVKFGKKYSIHMDSDLPIEVCCTFYGKGSYALDKLNTLEYLTYQKIRCNKFFDGFAYTKLSKDNLSPEDETGKRTELLTSDYYFHEDDLKLVLKIPFDNDSSITIFEDNANYTNEYYIENNDEYNYKLCNSVLNFEKSSIDEDGKEVSRNLNDLPTKSKSQLLFINDNICHPFADRLIEYLTDNAITHLDKISDNISRIQIQLNNLYSSSKGNIGLSKYKFQGIWEENYKPIIYEVARNKGLVDNKCDILGYVDKDVERKLGDEPDLYSDLWYEEVE